MPPELCARVRWLDALPQKPLRGVILANEVADALPFQCFAVRAGGYDERGVAIDASGPCSLGRSARPRWTLRHGDRRGWRNRWSRPFAVGYRSELCLRVGPWMAGLAARSRPGASAASDYGLGRRELYHPQRDAGTLRCHYRHRAHEDPFLYPGLQDISAWVDFTRLAEAASAAGLEVAGYCTQAAFLLGAGIDAELGVERRRAVERARAASEARHSADAG